MKILIPYDVTTTGMKNPYLFLLMRSLMQTERIQSVQHGYGWLYENVDANIIHLHWPELLVKSKLADMSRTEMIKESHFEEVIGAIESWKKRGTKFIITIHNEKPHKDPNNRFDLFYRQVYERMDGFIHMGEFSKNLLVNEYQNETANKSAFVIPHGDYRFFANNLDRETCREKLRVQSSEKLLLAFGAIRNRKELELGIDAFKTAGIENSVYLMAGKLPFPYKSQPEHFTARKKLYANMFSKKIRTAEEMIAPNEVQIYLIAADLVIIPRYNTLNSGNVALGFTFGKVVIGPDYGVIGETLKAAGNPVFDPHNIDSVSAAIHEGFRLAEAGQGQKNKEFADREMSWQNIGESTVKAYQTVLKS